MLLAQRPSLLGGHAWHGKISRGEVQVEPTNDKQDRTPQGLDSLSNITDVTCPPLTFQIGCEYEDDSNGDERCMNA